MEPLDVVKLKPLMERTSGRPEIVVGLIDGPVAINHPDLVGAKIHLSAALAQPSSNSHRQLREALDYATRRGAIVVAAAGNQGTLGSSAITRHPWVISVVACDLQGRPMSQSNLGSSIGRRGLRAPGDNMVLLQIMG